MHQPKKKQKKRKMIFINNLKNSVIGQKKHGTLIVMYVKWEKC